MEFKSLKGVGIKEGKYVAILAREGVAGRLVEYAAELKDGEVEVVKALIGTHLVDLSPFFENEEVSESLIYFLQLIRVKQAEARAEEGKRGVCV